MQSREVERSMQRAEALVAAVVVVVVVVVVFVEDFYRPIGFTPPLRSCSVLRLGGSCATEVLQRLAAGAGSLLGHQLTKSELGKGTESMLFFSLPSCSCCTQLICSWISICVPRQKLKEH